MSNNYQQSMNVFAESVLNTLESNKTEDSSIEKVYLKENKIGVGGISLLTECLLNEIQLVLFKHSHTFKLTSDLTNVLFNTDNTFKFVHPPYPNMFLDTKLKIKNATIYGIFIIDYTQDLTNYDYGHNHKESITILNKIKKNINNKSQKSFSICFCIKDNDNENNSSFVQLTSEEKQGGMIWDDFKLESLKNKNKSNEKQMIDNPIVRRSITNFVFSFLNFLYHPEIELVKKNSNSINLRRKDLQKVPNSYYIAYHGKLRRYITEFNSLYSKRDYMRQTHSWLVRGFYRNLRSDIYKEKKGTIIFIAPFIKGIGKLKEKSYLLKDKEETLWTSQFHLQQIIKEIFSEHLVLNNTRGFLDGYEIDIYVPDLKLGFEYNGKQHYEFVDRFHKDETDLDKQKERDEIKNRIAKERGIKLITIRYDEPLTKEYIENKLK